MIYEFAATQDLHGYGKPWAPGAGRNKLSIDPAIVTSTINGVTFTINRNSKGDVTSIVCNGTATFRTYFSLGQYDISGGKILNGCPEGGSYASYSLGIDSTSITDTGSGAAIENDLQNAKLQIVIGNNCVCNNLIFKPMIRASDDSDSSFAPYSNVCMPEGFNIWNSDNAEYVQVYAGYVNANTRELYLRPVYQEYAGEELVGPWMSSLDPYAEDTTPTEGAFVIDFGGELTSFEITPFMLQTLLDSLGIRQHFTDGAGLLNKLMDQAQGRVRSEEELLHLSRPLNVIAIGDQLPAGLTFKPISKDVLPGLPGKFIR